MRVLWLGILLVSLSFAAFAESTRDQTLRQYLDGSGDSRIARIGAAPSVPCNCSDGQALDGTGGLIFNCICGTMQCVVVGPRTGGPNGDAAHSLVCR